MSIFNSPAIIGASVRIAKLYGTGTPIGIRAKVRLERAFGRKSILEVMLPRIAGLPAFQHISGQRCSPSYYVRRNLSAYERDQRERDARVQS